MRRLVLTSIYQANILILTHKHTQLRYAVNNLDRADRDCANMLNTRIFVILVLICWLMQYLLDCCEKLVVVCHTDVIASAVTVVFNRRSFVLLGAQLLKERVRRAISH